MKPAARLALPLLALLAACAPAAALGPLDEAPVVPPLPPVDPVLSKENLTALSAADPQPLLAAPGAVSEYAGDASEPLVDWSVDSRSSTGSARPVAQNRGAQIEPETAATVAAGTTLGLGLLFTFATLIKSLAAGTLAFPFFSRIETDHLLENKIRNRIHELVEHNPGITIQEVVEQASVGWGTAVYHLVRLEQQRLIVSQRHRQFRRFFKNGGLVANDDKTAFAELKHPLTQRLATHVLQAPGAAQKDLCQVAGISAPLAHKYLSRLEESHLVTKQRDQKSVRYFPTDLLSNLLQPAVASAVAA